MIFSGFKRLVLCIICGLIISGCGIPPEEAAEKGLKLYENNQLKKAYPLLERAHLGGIEKPELALCLAYCKITIDNDPSGAIEILRDSALRYPDYAPTYYQLGLISYNFGPVEDNKNLEQAIHFARKAVELGSDEWLYHDNLGTYLYLIGQPDSALVHFKIAVQLNPMDKKLTERVEKLELKLSQRDSAAITEMK